MRPESPSLPFLKIQTDTLFRSVVALWMVVIAVVAIRGYLQPRKNSVYPIYYLAAENFLRSGPVYGNQNHDQGIDVYRYPPCCTVLFLPFTLMEENLGSLVWRCLQGFALLGATLCLGLRICHFPGDFGREPRGMASALLLLSLPLSVSSLNNGQLNCLVSAGLVMALVLSLEGKWTVAGMILAFPVIFKIFPIALVLLLGIVAPVRFSLGFLGTLFFLIGWPFLAFDTAYLSAQYREWWSFLGGDGRHHWPIEAGYRDLWMLLRLAGFEIPVPIYQAIQVSLGLACALWIGWMSWGKTNPKAPVACYLISILWMMLCGPSTESSTYTIAAPVLGLCAVGALKGRDGLLARLLLGLGCLLLMFGALVPAFPHGNRLQAWGIQPLGALFLTMGVVVSHFWRCDSRFRDGDEFAPTTAQTRANPYPGKEGAAA